MDCSMWGKCRLIGHACHVHVQCEAVFQCTRYTHVEVSYGGGGQLFISRSSVLCGGAELITARCVDDRVGEMFGLRTALECQALCKKA